MLAFDRGLIFGSCAGESFGLPLIILGITLAIAGAAFWLVRAYGLTGVRILPWILLAVGVASTGIAAAALAFGPITARIVRDGPTISIATCRGGREETRAFDNSGLLGRFILEGTGKGPPSPLLRLFAGSEQVAQVWLGHPGANVDALAGIAPQAISQYRSWRGR